MAEPLPASVVSEEIVAAEPVRAIEPYRSPAVPVVAQAAAAAATGFAAGIVTVAMARRRSTRRAVRRGRGALPVVASRSFVVDIHLLER